MSNEALSGILPLARARPLRLRDFSYDPWRGTYPWRWDLFGLGVLERIMRIVGFCDYLQMISHNGIIIP